MIAGTSIRAVETEDREAILALLQDAFGQAAEASLVEALWKQDAITVERVAEIDRKAVGYIAYSPVTTEPPLTGKLLGLAPLAVASSHQKQGIGSALTKDTLKSIEDDDAALVVVLGEPDYYSRFGFQPASAKNMAWAEMEAAGDAFRVICRDDVDTRVKRKVHYHPAFDTVS